MKSAYLRVPLNPLAPMFPRNPVGPGSPGTPGGAVGRPSESPASTNTHANLHPLEVTLTAE